MSDLDRKRKMVIDFLQRTNNAHDVELYEFASRLAGRHAGRLLSRSGARRRRRR